MSSRQALEVELARLAERYEAQPAGRVFAPLADCHRKLGQLDTALQICLAGLARHPEYSSAQLILGKIFLDRGEDDQARESLERVLELDPHNLLAMRLLAELAERVGELHEAEARWRQLDALDYDSGLTEERLAEIARRRREATEPVAPEVDEDDGGPESGPADSDAWEEEIELELDDSAAGSDQEPEPAADPELESPAFAESDATSSRPGQTSEIATLTLAGIYAEQGFRLKALEIYRAIAQRNPDLPGLSDRIQNLEAAMIRADEEATVEDKQRETSPRSGGLEVVSSVPALPDTEESPQPTRSGPLFSELPQAPNPVGDDATRYQRFGSWLQRVKSQDDD